MVSRLRLRRWMPNRAKQRGLPRSDDAVLTASAQKTQPRESPSQGIRILREDDSTPGLRLRFAEVDISHPVPSRVGSAEQSNSSILYGDKLILKLFRRLQPGENPDVEIGRFLTEIVHFEHVAAFLGEISIILANREKTTVAMLQGLVANQGDGWAWYLKQLADFYSLIVDDSEPPDVPNPSFVSKPEPVSRLLDSARPSLEAAKLLGVRTAEMHLALSSSTDLPDFAPEPFTSEDLDRDARRIEAQVSSALEALKAKLTTLDEPTSDAAGLLISKRPDLIARSQAISISTAAGMRIRIHGDYHLGQTLRTGGAQAANSQTDTGIKDRGPWNRRRATRGPGISSCLISKGNRPGPSRSAAASSRH